MKKRKFKLFASVAAFALTGAMMTFGVLAAASHAVNVTTNVGFSSNGANGTIQIDVSGNAVSATDNTTEAAFSKKASFTPSTFTPLAVEEVAEVSPAITTDGWTSNTLALGDLIFVQDAGEAQDIIISFTITKTGGANDNILTTTIRVYNETAPTLSGEGASEALDFTTADTAVALENGTTAPENVTIKCNVANATAATGAAANATATITFTIHVVDSGIEVSGIPLYFHVNVADGVQSNG